MRKYEIHRTECIAQFLTTNRNILLCSPMEKFVVQGKNNARRLLGLVFYGLVFPPPFVVVEIKRCFSDGTLKIDQSP